MTRTLTETDRAHLNSLIVQGYSRTQIAKKLKTKNKTLEKLCLENDIPLLKKGNKTFIKDNTDGILVVKGTNLYFKNSSQLYFLLNCEFDQNTCSVETFQETFKIIKNDKEIIIP